jgi:hypothetical protein
LKTVTRNGQKLKLFVTAAAFIALLGCVSVNLGPKASGHSKGVEYQSPSSPYSSMKNTSADEAWLNKANGDSISFFSTCNDPADPTLEAIAHDLFAGLTDLTVVQQNQPTFNGREALKIEVQGRVDGVPTQIAALLFKKNGCSYTLSHVGQPKTFAQDQKTFEDFLRSFVAP